MTSRHFGTHKSVTSCHGARRRRQRSAPASLEAYLRAFDLDTGELVGEIELPGNAYGSPMTYMVDGRQYIAVPMGNSNSAPELVALALPIR